jgi:hypothetical protein
VTEHWPENIQNLIKEAAVETARASFRAFEQLGAMPELYYYDRETDKARFYTDQENYEGQMSVVQLWSSVGARRMIHDFAFIQGYILSPEVL